jgi:hypothetical protein
MEPASPNMSKGAPPHVLKVQLFPRRKTGPKASRDAGVALSREESFPRGRQPTLIDYETVASHFSVPQGIAASMLGISVTSLKAVCRRMGVHRWPYRRVRKEDACRATDCRVSAAVGHAISESTTVGEPGSATPMPPVYDDGGADAGLRMSPTYYLWEALPSVGSDVDHLTACLESQPHWHVCLQGGGLGPAESRPVLAGLATGLATVGCACPTKDRLAGAHVSRSTSVQWCKHSDDKLEEV